MDKVNAALMHLNEAVDTKCKTKYKTIQEKLQHHSRQIHENMSIARPWNCEDFIERSLTFSKTMTWFAKPGLINPLVCSLHGWTNSNVDTLHCLHCSKSLVHDKDDLKGEMLHSGLKSSHENFCPWFTNICPIQFLQFPEYSHDQMINDFITRFIHILGGIEHTLSSTINEVVNTKELVLAVPTTILTRLSDLKQIINGNDSKGSTTISCIGSMVNNQRVASFVQFKKSQLELLYKTCIASSCHTMSRLAILICDMIMSTIKEKHNDSVEMTTKMKQYVQSLVLVSLLLSLSGWSPTQKPLQLLSTPSTECDENLQPPTALIQSPAAGTARLSCSLCGRTVDLNYFCAGDNNYSSSSSNNLLAQSHHHRRLSGRVAISHDDDDDSSNSNSPNVFDPLAQHRSYCPWVSVTTTSSISSIIGDTNATTLADTVVDTSAMNTTINPVTVNTNITGQADKNQTIARCGWEIIADELFTTSSTWQQQQESNASIIQQQPLLPTDKRNHHQLQNNDTPVITTTTTIASPENAYKRIKSVLDMAVQPYDSQQRQQQQQRKSYG